MFKLAVLMLLAVPAQAETTRTKAPTPATQRYDFDDDVVEGGVLSPDGVIVDSTRAIKRSSLIKIRETFVPELLKSAEDL